MRMTSCTGSVRGRFEESQWVEFSVRRRRLTFGARRVLAAGAARGGGGGADGKVVIERLCLSLPYVKKPFNSNVIKSFVLELRSQVFFFLVFRDSYIYIYIYIYILYNIWVMNILCTFHISVSCVCYRYIYIYIYIYIIKRKDTYDCAFRLVHILLKYAIMHLDGFYLITWCWKVFIFYSPFLATPFINNSSTCAFNLFHGVTSIYEHMQITVVKKEPPVGNVAPFARFSSYVLYLLFKLEKK